MKSLKQNKHAFTLTEMLIVLLIISSLAAFVLPNLLKTKQKVDTEACTAYMKLVEGQVQLYLLESDEPLESLETLESAGYIEATTCPDGRELTLDLTTYKVSIKKEEEE